MQTASWAYLPASLLKLHCGDSTARKAKQPFMLEIQDAPPFSQADGVYVATTTVHLERRVYLKVTKDIMESFPQELIPKKHQLAMNRIEDTVDRLLVPTAKGYCVQTLIGTQEP
jgi:hypothetical protein